MHRHYLYFTAAILSACASSPIQTMSLKDAVNFGTDQYYNTPNYAFKSNTHIELFDFGLQGDANKDISPIFNRLFKRMSFDMTGVVDTPNKQYQVTPTFQYKAKNLQAALSFPMVYDGKQQHFLIDVSAFDALLGNGDNDGKYSRFDVSKFNVNDKGEKMLSIIQKYTRSNYSEMNNSAFIDLPLNNDDKHMNVVRKIQITAKLKDDAFNTTGMMKEVVGLLKTPDKETDDSDAIIKEFSQSEAKSKELINPDSKQTSILSFDKEGRIIQAQVSIDMSMKSATPTLLSDSSIRHMRPSARKKEYDTRAEANVDANENATSTRMKATTTFSMSDIGHAQLVNPPTADNTVDGIENFKSGFLVKKLTEIFKPKTMDDASDVVDATQRKK